MPPDPASFRVVRESLSEREGASAAETPQLQQALKKGMLLISVAVVFRRV